MEFIETSVFTKRITEYPDDDYRLLQKELALNPKAGKVIKGTGGLRKIRWNTPGKGKSGGLRVIYYNLTESTILMVFAFRKNEAENITDEEAHTLKALTQQIKKQVLKK
ncbi:MAG: type II toxin-antitoxin system RelE/ParE family toxin [Desulfobacteraceae bacterium]|jgi:hypothetical protein